MDRREADLLLARLDRIRAVCDAALAPRWSSTKEVTEMPYANVRPETTPNDEPMPGVRLQWGREAGYVQLVVLPFESGMPTEDARNDERYLWASLSRNGCNELIRQLRQARDDAFGADA
jgi:hypothetical protein